MLFRLTLEGQALLDQYPEGFTITSVVLAEDANFSLDPLPSSYTGDVVFTLTRNIPAKVLDANTLVYTVLLDAELPTMTFGNLALYSGATLVGLAVSNSLLTKVGPDGGVDGQPLPLNVFVDLEGSERFGAIDSGQSNSFARVATPDQLRPPAKNGDNAFVVYGLTALDTPYFAFADPTGKWGFSSKTRVAYTGQVEGAGPLGLMSSSAVGSYPGEATDLVLQFVTGPLRGYCRQLTLLELPTIQWSTPLAILPLVGDSFIIVSPELSSTGTTPAPDPVPTTGLLTKHFRLTNAAQLALNGGLVDTHTLAENDLVWPLTSSYTTPAITSPTGTYSFLMTLKVTLPQANLGVPNAVPVDLFLGISLSDPAYSVSDLVARCKQSVFFDGSTSVTLSFNHTFVVSGPENFTLTPLVGAGAYGLDGNFADYTLEIIQTRLTDYEAQTPVGPPLDI